MSIEVYKCDKKINPECLNDLFVPQHIVYEFRDKDQMVQPKFKTRTFGYRSFTYYGAKIWNSLPSDLKQSPTLNSFKKELAYLVQ